MAKMPGPWVLFEIWLWIATLTPILIRRDSADHAHVSLNTRLSVSHDAHVEAVAAVPSELHKVSRINAVAFSDVSSWSGKKVRKK